MPWELCGLLNWLNPLSVAYIVEVKSVDVSVGECVCDCVSVVGLPQRLIRGGGHAKYKVI